MFFLVTATATATTSARAHASSQRLYLELSELPVPGQRKGPTSIVDLQGHSTRFTPFTRSGRQEARWSVRRELARPLQHAPVLHWALGCARQASMPCAWGRHGRDRNERLALACSP